MFSLTSQLWTLKQKPKPLWVCLSQINFLIFIHIIKILVSKLRAHQMRYTDYKFRCGQVIFGVGGGSSPLDTSSGLLLTPLRLAKSTLTLIPLLGIHQVIFIFLTDESTKASHSLRVTKLFMDLFFSSFQVAMKTQSLFPKFAPSVIHNL